MPSRPWPRTCRRWRNPFGSASPTSGTSSEPSCARSWRAEPSAGLYRRGKDIASAADGLDQRRMGGIALQLLAQPADLGIDGAIIGRPFASLHQLDQLHAVEHPVWM